MYKVSKITTAQLDKIPAIAAEIKSLKEGSDDYSDDLYSIFKENDERLFTLAQKVLENDSDSGNKKTTEPKSKVKPKVSKKSNTPAKKAPRIPTFKTGSTIFLLNKSAKTFIPVKINSDDFKLNETKDDYLVSVIRPDGVEKEFPASRLQKTKPTKYSEIVSSTRKKNATKGSGNKLESTPVYSWKKTTEIKKLTPVTRSCHEYFLKVENDVLVSLKGTGNDSVEVTAKKGEYIMFNANRYATHVKNELAFKTDCAKINDDKVASLQSKLAPSGFKLLKGISAFESGKYFINAFYNTENSTYSISSKTQESTNDFSSYLEDEVVQQVSKLMLDIPKKSFPTPPLNVALNEAHKAIDELVEKDTSKSKSKVKKKKQKSKKRSVCSIEHEGKIPTVVKHLIGHVSDWHNNKISWQIKEVHRVDDTIVIGKADYKGIKGVMALLGKNYTYYRMCVETGNLTKVEKPTTRPVINSRRINEMYKLSGFHDFECAKLYRELLTCSIKGKCSHEQKNTFDKLATKCGDYIKTIETNPALMRAFYDEVRERRKDGEDWNAARTRVTKELKKEAAIKK